MGKTMSTAKQVSRSPIGKAANDAVLQTKPKQQLTRPVPPASNQPDVAYLQKLNTVDKSFNDRLKNVFVTSVDENPSWELPRERSMPKDRATPFSREPHSQTIENRQPNELMVEDLKLILSNYKTNPETWTIEYIAARYDISKEIIEKLVANVSSLESYYATVTSLNVKVHKPKEQLHSSTPLYEMEDKLVGKTENGKPSKNFMMILGDERGFKTAIELFNENRK